MNDDAWRMAELETWTANAEGMMSAAEEMQATTRVYEHGAGSTALNENLDRCFVSEFLPRLKTLMWVSGCLSSRILP